jgi:small subunit ribosomal protein S21
LNRRTKNFNQRDQIGGLHVEVRNGDFNGAMRRFKKKVQEAGIIQEIRERKEYTKPSEKRKKAKAAGRARWLKKVQKMDENWGVKR